MQVQIKDLMSRKVERTNPNLSVREAARTMHGLGVGCLPVNDGARLVGMVTDRDIVCRAIAAGHDVDRLCVRDVMTRDVVCCQEDQTPLEAAEIMRGRRVRRLLVFNHDAQIRGIISIDDLCDMIPGDTFVATMKALVRPPQPSPLD